MDSTLALLSEARCLSFRRLCASLDTDFEGLTIASRKAKTTKLISPALCRRLQQLDVAYAFARHITRPRVDRLIAAVDAELAALTPCRDTTTIEKSNEIFEIIDDCVNSPESPNSTSTESTRCSSSYTPSGVRDLCKDFEAAHFSIYDDDDDNNGETSDSLPAPGSAVKHLEVPASCASHFSIYDVDDDNNDETSDSFHAPGDAVRHLEVPASSDLGLPDASGDGELLGIDEEAADKILQQLANFRDAYAYIDMLCAENVAGSPDKLTTELLLNLDCDDESDQIIDQHRESMGINGALDNLCDYFVDSGVLT